MPAVAWPRAQSLQRLAGRHQLRPGHRPLLRAGRGTAGNRLLASHVVLSRTGCRKIMGWERATGLD
jgi:hypothetical protein